MSKLNFQFLGVGLSGDLMDPNTLFPPPAMSVSWFFQRHFLIILIILTTSVLCTFLYALQALSYSNFSVLNTFASSGAEFAKPLDLILYVQKSN